MKMIIPQEIPFEGLAVSTLHPIIKWAGGKEKELKHIIPNVPAYFENYYEPFVGGGSVFTALTANNYFINDKSTELISLYRYIACQNELFFTYLENIIASWDKISDYAKERIPSICEQYKSYRSNNITGDGIKTYANSFIDRDWPVVETIITPCFSLHTDMFKKELKKNLVRKILRMKELETERGLMPEKDIRENIETAFKGSLYMYYRNLYNDMSTTREKNELATALFVFIRNYCYSGMFRYNNNGLFNVPYGGIGYNPKTLRKKYEYYKSDELISKLQATIIESRDFEDFLMLHQPNETDFMFLDPPYDSEFSTYAKNEFTKEDQVRLATYLADKCRCKWMMVIKNTPFIRSLYEKDGLNIKIFDKKYLVSFMNRNQKEAKHLLITNY